MGETLEVLVEKLDVESALWSGRSHREAPEVDGEITFSSDALLSVGRFVEVRITANDGADLQGKHEA